ncbi:hypothetical protein ACB092_06G116500 [Castanea dentata]
MAVEAIEVSNLVVEQITSWSPPPPLTAGCLKVNVDGAIFSTQRMVRIGVVIRNEDGRFKAALSKKLMAPLGAMEAEKSPRLASVAVVIIGMQELCKDFIQIEFTHVRRQGNRPAHVLAKHASSIVECIVWIEEIPYYIEQDLIHDALSFSNV